MIGFSLIVKCQVYNATIGKVNTINANKGSIINIRQGNVVIGKIVLSEDSVKWKVYIDSTLQYKDQYDIWHTAFRFRSLDNSPMIAADLKLSFSDSVINIKNTMCCWAYGGISLNKRRYTFSSNQIQTNPFWIAVSSLSKVSVTFEGVIRKPN